ncbi:hypothetical protein [Metabacillus idriensis]|uniref:hypothetical protein n=1 Tax=Metabacillus idriensis TaxID=324768 RepID=UPI00174AE30F|nr:hypothetical protein [Metabacillus idriensis]
MRKQRAGKGLWALTTTMLLICVGVNGYLGLEFTDQNRWKSGSGENNQAAAS